MGGLESKYMSDVGFNSFASIGQFPCDKVATKTVSSDRLFEHMKRFFLEAGRQLDIPVTVTAFILVDFTSYSRARRYLQNSFKLRG